MKEKSCCFTGHRPQSLPWGFDENDARCVALKTKLRREIEEMITGRGVSHFISGMALGEDTWAAELVLELKATYSVTLECALPCEAQAVRWREPDRDRYCSIVERCDEETMVQTASTPDCFQKRNRYMIDRSAYVIAVFSGASGGTAETLRYAHEKGRTVRIIQPTETPLYVVKLPTDDGNRYH